VLNVIWKRRSLTDEWKARCGESRTAGLERGVEKRAVLRENLSCQPMQRALLLLYKGYLEQDYCIYLSPTTIKKIMALNRRVHLAPQRPAAVVEVRDPREGPKKNRYPFERIFVDLRYLDAKPGGVQLYSCTLLEGLSRTILFRLAHAGTGGRCGSTCLFSGAASLGTLGRVGL